MCTWGLSNMNWAFALYKFKRGAIIIILYTKRLESYINTFCSSNEFIYIWMYYTILVIISYIYIKCYQNKQEAEKLLKNIRNE